MVAGAAEIMSTHFSARPRTGGTHINVSTGVGIKAKMATVVMEADGALPWL